MKKAVDKDKEKLQKDAQKLLEQARKLIDDAGKLAKKGQFHLYFGEIGDFIPRSAVNLENFRKEALEELKREGRYNGYDRKSPTFEELPRTPYSELTADQIEVAVDALARELRDNQNIPHEFLEYADESDADCWWHPSRC